MIRARVASVAAALVVLATTATASAQQFVLAGNFSASTGLQGGGGREASVLRAPTRLRLGGELRVDEDLANGVAVGVLLDMEPRARVGVDIRYVRLFLQRFAVTVGGIGYLTPGTAIGPTASFEYRHPLGKSISLTAGPEVNVFVVGIDVPDKTVIWQTLLQVGLRVDL